MMPPVRQIKCYKFFTISIYANFIAKSHKKVKLYAGTSTPISTQQADSYLVAALNISTPMCVASLLPVCISGGTQRGRRTLTGHLVFFDLSVLKMEILDG